MMLSGLCRSWTCGYMGKEVVWFVNPLGDMFVSGINT